MKLTPAIILLASLFFGASNAFAASHNLQGADLIIYKETFENCSKAKDSILKTVINSDSMQTMLITTGQTLENLIVHPNPKEISNMLENRGLGVYASDRLSSIGFIFALNDCFPNSPRMKETYVISLITADTLAKIPAILGVMAELKIGSGISSGFSSLLGRFKSAYPKVFKTTMVASIVGMTYWSIHKAREEFLSDELTPGEEMRINQMKDSVDRGLNSNAENILAEGNDVIDALRNKLDTETNPEKIKKIKASIAEISGNLALLSKSN